MAFAHISRHDLTGCMCGLNDRGKFEDVVEIFANSRVMTREKELLTPGILLISVVRETIVDQFELFLNSRNYNFQFKFSFRRKICLT